MWSTMAASPSPVLAHGEDLGQSVVALREGREQLLREAVPVTGSVRRHAFLQG